MLIKIKLDLTQENGRGYQMIPVNEPLLDGKEHEYVAECIKTGWISSEGLYVKKFENDFANYIGKEFGIAVCNGTAAIETALYGIGIKEHDEIIMPSFTIISCALAALRLGAKPVLVDIEPETWNMDVEQVEKRITEKTRAIMPVHIYGHPVDMDPIMEIAKKRNLLIMEDAAEVHGAQYKGRNCGSFGLASSFSFYANKVITTGEGGMVVTNDEEVAERCRSFRNLCFRPDKRFYHTELGYNLRMTNIRAAIGCAQLEQIEKHIEIKRELGRYYKERLSDIREIKLQVEKEWAKTVYCLYCIELNEESGLNAEIMMRELRRYDIGTRPFFIGLHEQPLFKKMGLFVGEKYPVTEVASSQGLYLPSGLTLTKDQIDNVCDAIKKIIHSYKS